ncbi:GntR family transcriptional regulator [Streptomyces sp. NPDC007083]|uniref:GntR family transcriptional regulator n=1 Tax=Streptomyces sp. NPDC007083 TaxID=3156913 RepID=UPI003408EC8D
MPRRQQTRTAQTDRQLRSCLSRGCYRPGRKLTLMKLAVDLSVSTTVVQKILGPLIDEGLLEKKTGNRSATVPTEPTAAEAVRVPCRHSTHSPGYPEHLATEAVRRLRQRLASCCYQPGDTSPTSNWPGTSAYRSRVRRRPSSRWHATATWYCSPPSRPSESPTGTSTPDHAPLPTGPPASPDSNEPQRTPSEPPPPPPRLRKGIP